MNQRELDQLVYELQKRIIDLERLVGNPPVRLPGGGGGGSSTGILTYVLFPSIPSKPTIIDCKGDLWFATSGFSAWKPCSGFTQYTGVPGS